MRCRLALMSLFLAGVLAPVLAQPGGAADTVKYRDRTKDGAEVQKIGEVKESPAGLVVASTGGKNVTISAADVITLQYGALPGVEDKDRQAIPAVEAKGGVEARNFFTELQKKTVANSAASEKTKRYLEFKTAMWTARVADTKTGDEFRSEAIAAIPQLIGVARSYPKSWEVWPAYRTAARLQAEMGKFTEAAQTLASLAKADGLPAELQNEAKLAQAEVLLRSGVTSNAEPAFAEVAKIASLTPAQKERVALYQAVLKAAADKTDPAKVQVAAKGIRDSIEKMSDTSGKAAGHNALGELYLMANLNRDAMWEFLWVEAVHNTDRDEVAKALERLADLFEKGGEKDRAAVYREKLVKAKGA